MAQFFNTLAQCLKRWADRGLSVRLIMLRIGLAMLQGARHEHAEALRYAADEIEVEVEIVELRKSHHVDSSISALILPGGESTSMRKASQSESLLKGLFEWMKNNPKRPVLGTCAGAILLAQPSDHEKPFIDAEISRNAWGRQRESFEAPVDVNLETPIAIRTTDFEHRRDRFNHKPLVISHEAATSDDESFPGVFIRAPRFDSQSINCSVIAKMGDEVVGVMKESRLALTFHPELTLDRRFHRWLIDTANNNFTEN